MKKKKDGMSKGVSKSEMAAIGAGAAAVGAGAYYLLGPKSKAHQKKASILMNKIKKEVQSEIKKAKKVTTPLYHKAVDTIAKNYSREYQAHEKDIKNFAKKLKGEWRTLTK